MSDLQIVFLRLTLMRRRTFLRGTGMTRMPFLLLGRPCLTSSPGMPGTLSQRCEQTLVDFGVVPF